MNIIVCIGGSGMRCMEAIAFMAGANLMGNSHYDVIMIDKDETNGQTENTKTTLISYADIRAMAGEQNSLFAPSFSKSDWSFDAVVSSMHNDGANEDRLRVRAAEPGENKEDATALFNMIYSEDEQNTPLNNGFYGHPSIGALLFRYATSPKALKNPKNAAFQTIKNRVVSGDTDIKVFVIGSVFGGTGAAIFPNVAQLFKQLLADVPNLHLTIGGALLLPYFSIPAGSGSNITSITDSEWMQKTKVALNQYQNWDLMGKDGSLFDSLYLVGTSPRSCTAHVNVKGGPSQINEFSLTDFYAGSAVSHFFKDEKAGLYFAMASKTPLSIFDWSCFPSTDNVKQNLTQMSVFALYITMGVYPQYLMIPKKRRSQALCQIYGKDFFGAAKIKSEEEIDAFQTKLNTLYHYCTGFLRFVLDLSMDGNDWSIQPIQPANPDIHTNLFSREYLYQVLGLIDKLNMDVGRLEPTSFTEAHKFGKLFEMNYNTDDFSGISRSLDQGLPYGSFDRWLCALYNCCISDNGNLR